MSCFGFPCCTFTDESTPLNKENISKLKSYFHQVKIHKSQFNRKAQLTELKELIDKNPQYINKKNIGYLLVSACYAENIEIVKFLYTYDNADINTIDTDGKSLLAIAVVTYNIKLIKFLIINGADINVKIYNLSLLNYAIKIGYIELIDTLFLYKPDSININETYKGQSLLMITIMNRYNLKVSFYYIINRLLEFGININIQNIKGETALMIAIDHLIYYSASLNEDKINNKNKINRNRNKHNNMSDRSNINNNNINHNENNINNINYNNDIGNYIKLIKYLVKNGADVNLQDLKGETALMKAIYRKDSRLVKYLVKNGADVNLKDLEGETALMKAVVIGKIDILESLKMETEVNLQDLKGETALMKAAFIGKIDILESLLKMEADVNLQDLEGETALMKSRNFNITNHLVYNNANCSLKNNKGETALMKAVYIRNFDIVEYLAGKIDIDLEDNEGETALMKAIKIKDVDIVYELIKYRANLDIKDKNGETLLMKAVNIQNLNIINELIKYGEDVNLQDNNGETALMKAVNIQIPYITKENFLIVIDTLVQNTNVNLQNEEGETALMKALDNLNINSKELIEIVKYFINKGNIEVNLQNKIGETALMKEVNKENPNKHVIDFLLLNSNIYLRDKKGETVLMKAVNIGHHIIVKKLIKYSIAKYITNEQESNRSKKVSNIGMNKYTYTSIQDEKGETALMKAVNMKNYKIINFLVEKYSDVNIKDKKGETSLMKAVNTHLNLNTVIYLVKNGADVNLQDIKGETVLMKAVNMQNYDVIKYLVKEANADLTLKDNNGKDAHLLARESILNNTQLSGINKVSSKIISFFNNLYKITNKNNDKTNN